MNKQVYYEITNTTGNVPIAIYYHYKAPIQLVFAHWHRSLELTLNLEGSVDFYNSNRLKRLYENQVSISNSEGIHYSIPHYDCYEDKIVGITLRINYEFLKSLIPDFDKIRFKLENPDIEKLIANYIKKISQLYDSNSDDKYIKIFSQVLLIIDLLYGNCKEENKFKISNKMKEILNYLHANFNHEIYLYQIANYFGYSREYFSRMFKKEIGLSFKQYLDKYRIEKAIQLLKSTDKSILEIGYEVGFSNENQFIYTFKKHYKMTPGKFKKSLFKD